MEFTLQLEGAGHGVNNGRMNMSETSIDRDQKGKGKNMKSHYSTPSEEFIKDTKMVSEMNAWIERQGKFHDIPHLVETLKQLESESKSLMSVYDEKPYNRHLKRWDRILEKLFNEVEELRTFRVDRSAKAVQ